MNLSRTNCQTSFCGLLTETGTQVVLPPELYAPFDDKMPAFYKIDKERRLVLSSGTGVFSKEDALSHQNRLLADPDFDPSFSQLLDFTHITQIDLSTADVQQLALRNIFSRDSRRAILVTNDLAFGFGRMYEILRESAGEHGIRVFRTLEAALDWVLSKPDAP